MTTSGLNKTAYTCTLSLSRLLCLWVTQSGSELLSELVSQSGNHSLGRATGSATQKQMPTVSQLSPSSAQTDKQPRAWGTLFRIAFGSPA